MPLENYSCAIWARMINPVESQIRFKPTHTPLVVGNT